MQLTRHGRLTAKNLVQDLCNRRNVTNREDIDFAVESVLGKLETEEAREITIDGVSATGVVTPLAWMYIPKCEGMERDGKKYLRCSDDWIVLFCDGNEARLLREHTNMYQPNGWGDEEDYIKEPNTWTTATNRDFDGIFDMLYV